MLKFGDIDQQQCHKCTKNNNVF